MRIPLDYYRILGLPIQASHEQLQQAYRDRALQLPRREYSEAAIAARKQILEEAYAVLSNPEQRSRYDHGYLTQTYDQHEQDAAVANDDNSGLHLGAVDPRTPSIEISDNQLVGALLILQELGEYEIVLKLGRPYLGHKATQSSRGFDQVDTDLIHADIVLTLALACLELGREQWQQGQYENAAISLETGQELVLREGLFPSLRGEVQADLYKLRPYRILELLARPEENVVERRQGLKLLQSILQERGGIDGTGNDGSGLGIDDFLRFIQQLRSYLTATEQQSLFEAESRRPSAVATYLAVYSLLARGFAQRQPALIRQAKLLLMRLGKRQDVHLEQAVCSLLLGQTEEASRALELSQEYEPLAFIREHSQGAPDLLPGLCLYGERWLQTEVFPHFRDLAQQQASLKDYFADPQVQSYLEVLPTEAEVTNEWDVVAPESLAYAQTATRRVSTVGVSQARTQGGRDNVGGVPSVQTYNGGSPLAATVGDPANSVQATVATLSVTPGGVTPNSITSNTALPTRAAGATLDPPDFNDATTLRQNGQLQQSRRRTRNQAADGLVTDGEARSPRQGRPLDFGKSISIKKAQLILLVAAGLVGIVILGLLVSQAYRWFRQSAPASSLQGEQPLVQLAQPPVAIPAPNTAPLVAAGVLNQETAEEVVQNWLTTKAEALGSDHAVNKLEQILVPPALSQWQEVAQKDKTDGQYRQYKHNLKVESVNTSPASPDKASVEATVNEAAEVYQDSQLKKASSYDEKLRVRYDLVRKDGQWRIKDMTVVK